MGTALRLNSRDKADKQIIYSLICLLCFTLFAHLLFRLAYNAAANAQELYPFKQSVFKLPTFAGDTRQEMLSTEVLNHPCKFNLKLRCAAGDDEESSEAVQKLAKEQLPPHTQQLLEKHEYESAFDLAVALSVEGRDREAISLLGNSVFRVGRGKNPWARANFADKWYLYPAFAYLTHSRDYDALQLFKSYLAIMQYSVNDGEWLSYDGLDATDLPVLARLFCPHPEGLARDECLLSILQLADDNSPYFSGTNYGAESQDNYVDSSHRKRQTLFDTYSGIPSYRQSAPISQYLKVLSWNGYDQPEPQPGPMEAIQQFAWEYSLGVRLLEPGGEKPGCAARIQRAKGLFKAVASNNDPNNVFSQPATNRLTFISSHLADICAMKEVEKSNE
jgi:hypothetical protein